MIKKKFLLVEYTAHFRNALDNFKMFKKFYNCYFLTTKENKNKIKLNNNKIIFKLPRFLILFYVILNGYKYKYIYFSTPHELPDYPVGIKRKISFLYTFLLHSIIFLIYKKKVILQLRSLHRYFPNIKSIPKNVIFYNKLRNLYLQNCQNIVCESEYLKKKLIRKLGKINCFDKKIIVLYYAYSKQNTKIKIKFSKKKLNIGILGTVDNNRKDYNILIKILENKFFLDKKISLTFLGAANNYLGKKKIKEFSKFSKKIISKNYFTEKDFLKIGKKCDFLISLNNKTNFYGEFRMSGCFGDSILLKKYLYCPSFEDPYREFSDFTFYFENPNHVINNIKLCTTKNQTIFFNKFKYEQSIETIENNFEIK